MSLESPIHNPRQRSRGRFGGNAIEFAMIMPVFLSIVFGMADYGWFYFQQSLSEHAVVVAMRAGAMKRPYDYEQGMGACSQCVATVQEKAVANLYDVGVSVSSAEVTPQLVSVGGSCTLVLQSKIQHTPLIGFVPVPAYYQFQTSIAAPAVMGCGATI